MTKSKPSSKSNPAKPAKKNTSVRSASAKPTSAPVSKQSKTGFRRPKMYYVGEDFHVEHDEFVADVLTDVANVFAYDVYTIDPSDAITFPWLSPIAKRFEVAECRSFVPRVEPACSTNTQGRIALSIDYDPDDSTSSATKTELLNADRSTSGAMWQCVEHHSTGKNLALLTKRKFIRQDGLDDRLDSFGNLFVVTTASNVAGGTMVAELWIRYHFVFSTPTLHTAFSVLAPARTSTVTDGVATTDAWIGLSKAQNVSITPFEKSGLALGPQNQTQGLQTPAEAYVFANSGSAVPDGQVIAKFVEDWAGTIVTRWDSGSGTTTIPDTTAAVSAVVQSGVRKYAPAAIDFAVDVARKSTLGSSLMEAVIDVVAPAGTGLVFSSPFWTGSTTGISWSAYPTPTNLAAFRDMIRSKNGLPVRQRRTNAQVPMVPKNRALILEPSPPVPLAPAAAPTTSAESATSSTSSSSSERPSPLSAATRLALDERAPMSHQALCAIARRANISVEQLVAAFD